VDLIKSNFFCIIALILIDQPHQIMAKIIRKAYPAEYSIGLLLLIYASSCFLSFQIFKAQGHHLNEGKNIYPGVLLVSSAVIIMLLVIWEELLFPVSVKIEDGGLVFRNHRTKLKKQLLIYAFIPAIFVFIYYTYEVNLVRFIVWASICILAPVIGKLISGLKNYNDFLKLTATIIEYKNNDKAGIFPLVDIGRIVPVRDERNILHKIQLVMNDNKQQPITIDLDEMEIEVFYVSIDKFITTHYNHLIKG
jgi:hypothetical protein